MIDDFFQDNTNKTNFVLSPQLLCLLQWLIEHEAEALRKIVNKALNAGLFEEIRGAEIEDANQAHHSILDFFSLVEEELIEGINERVRQQARDKKLVPSIDQIDSTICSPEIVESSLRKISAKIDTDSQEKAQELLFQELLKRWKPDNKNTFN